MKMKMIKFMCRYYSISMLFVRYDIISTNRNWFIYFLSLIYNTYDPSLNELVFNLDRTRREREILEV